MPPYVVRFECAYRSTKGNRLDVIVTATLLVLMGWAFMGPLVIPPCWRLFRQRGVPPGLSLLLVVPFLGLVFALTVLAVRSPVSVTTVHGQASG